MSPTVANHRTPLTRRARPWHTGIWGSPHPSIQARITIANHGAPLTCQDRRWHAGIWGSPMPPTALINPGPVRRPQPRGPSDLSSKPLACRPFGFTDVAHRPQPQRPSDLSSPTLAGGALGLTVVAYYIHLSGRQAPRCGTPVITISRITPTSSTPSPALIISTI